MKILALLVCCLGLLGCMKDPGKEKYIDFSKQDMSKVLFYGQEVYYFEYVGADFGNALADFLRRNSGLVVAGIAAHTSAHGAPEGYFVVFQSKQK